MAEHKKVAWTIVRPTALTNRPPTGYAASLELQSKTFVTSRVDVAAFIADELENNSYVRQAVFVTSLRKQEKGD